MKEVEVLVQVVEEDSQKVFDKILNVASFVSETKVLDQYYYDPLRKNLQPDENMAIYECFRIREKNNKVLLTYKIDRFDENGKWLYSDENETKVEDKEEIASIIKCLGLKPLVTVDMVKRYYETDVYTIAVEYVDKLGIFLEVESKKQFEDEQEIKNERNQIQTFIENLGFETTADLGIGKPELLLIKIGIIE